MSTTYLNKPPRFGIIKAEEQIQVNIIYEFIKDKLNFKRDPDLVGHPIRVTEAAEKYGVSHANLSHWADAGMIRIIQRRNRLLELDEADVSLVSSIFKEARKHTTPRRAAWVLKAAMTPT